MGLWVPLHPPSSRVRVIESGHETAESAAASLVLKTFGHLVRKIWVERNPDEVKYSCGDLLAPFGPFMPGQEPEVIEDGTKGVATFKFETEDAGPAWLHRDG